MQLATAEVNKVKKRRGRKGNVIKLRWQNKDLYTRNGIGVFFL